MKIPFDKVIASIAGLGVPSLVLIVAIFAGGLAGGAAIVAALALLGGPLGMLGGLALLGVLVMISKAITDYGFEVVFKAVLKKLKERGVTKQEILRKIAEYPISDDLKAKLQNYINDLYE